MKKLLLAAVFTAAPAAAQTTVRAPVLGLNIFPGLGTVPMLMPTLPSKITALILGVSFSPPRLGPPLLLPKASAINPLPDSPLSVIRDASATETERAAALSQLFDNSVPSSHEASAVSAQSPAPTPESSSEFSQAPAWFDASQLKFDAIVKSETGGTAVLRYGWRSQYEMSVFAFPGSASISFKEYSANPMSHPKQSFDATLETAAARKAAAKILRDAQARNPVSGKDKAALDKILAFLDGDGEGR